MPPRLGLLRSVALVSTIFSFALVVWGAIVRINGAGMTCPDWPRCRGVWFPALDPKVVYEYYHRVGAAVLTVIVVATFIAAVLARKDAPAALRAAWVSLGLIVAQVVAGAVTIFLQNDAPSVAVHLVIGFATFASLLVVTLVAYLQPSGAAPAAGGDRFKWLALSTTLVAFLAVFAAGWMAASNDGLACTALPLCGASGDMTPGQQIHMWHRYAAYVTIAAAVVTWTAMLRTAGLDPAARLMAWVAFALAIVQGCLGVAAILTRLEPVIRSWHEANAALLVASLVALTYFAFRPRRASA